MKKISVFLLLFLLAIGEALGQPVGQIPSGTVWGNSTASRAPASAATLTALLDRAISGTQGSILTRNSTSWVGLAPGTAGLPLVSAGAGVNLSYGIAGLNGGGTGAALTASIGGLVYSTNSALAILAGTATANQIPLSGASAAPSWSTATYPGTAAARSVLNAVTSNVISATTTPIVNGLTINNNSGNLPAPPSSASVLQLGNADGVSTRLLIDSFGTGVAPVVTGRSARNIAASPTATQSDDILFGMQGLGYGATGYSSSSRGSALILSGGNWTDASQPTYFSVWVTPSGSTTSAERFRVDKDGSLKAFGSSSGTATITAQAAAGTPTLTLPTATGTFVTTATAPLAIDATTGAVSVTGILGVANGGLGASLSATGGTSQVLKQVSAGAAITVGQLAAGDLSDYAEGTFTPSFTFATPGNLSLTYSVQLGSYVRVGKIVTATFNIVSSAFTWTTSSGASYITGLPFTAKNTGEIWTGSMGVGGITKAGWTQFIPRILANTSQMEIVANTSGSASTNVVAADYPSGGTLNLRGTITYQIQ